MPVGFSLRAIGTWDQTGEAPTGLSHSGHSSSSWSGAGQLLFWGHRDKRHPDAGGDVAPVPQVARQSLTMFVLIMNGGHIEIDAHRLNDGGLLLSYDGNSYTTYMKEEVDRCVGGSQPERGSTLCPPQLAPKLFVVTIWERGAPRTAHRVRDPQGCLRERGCSRPDVGAPGRRPSPPPVTGSPSATRRACLRRRTTPRSCGPPRPGS